MRDAETALPFLLGELGTRATMSTMAQHTYRPRLRSVGESFTVESTTFTCTEIGDDSIVLDLVRG